MLSLILALLATPLPPPSALTLPVVFHVPTVAGKPSVDAAWMDLRLAETNRVFKPHGLQFRRAAVRPLVAKHAIADHRGQRDGLAPLNRPGVINVYVVNRLMDIHEKGRVRQGVHWKVRTPGRSVRTRYVIVAAYSVPGVLPHELGHYLGHARHSKVPDNLMCYTRTGKRKPFLSTQQGRAMARKARRLFKHKVLRP
jgi:hypothetical protein